MSLFSTLFNVLFASESTSERMNDTMTYSTQLHDIDINPANGMPMISDSGIDVEGNLYGTDHTTMMDRFGLSSHDWSSSDHHWDSSNSFIDSDWS